MYRNGAGMIECKRANGQIQRATEFCPLRIFARICARMIAILLAPLTQFGTPSDISDKILLRAARESVMKTALLSELSSQGGQRVRESNPVLTFRHVAQFRHKSALDCALDAIAR